MKSTVNTIINANDVITQPDKARVRARGNARVRVRTRANAGNLANTSIRALAHAQVLNDQFLY